MVIERAREHLGWVPRVGLEDGLRATINYFALQTVPAIVIRRPRTAVRTLLPGLPQQKRAVAQPALSSEGALR